jgi:hypothetical protein
MTADKAGQGSTASPDSDKGIPLVTGRTRHALNLSGLEPETTLCLEQQSVFHRLFTGLTGIAKVQENRLEMRKVEFLCFFLHHAL